MPVTAKTVATGSWKASKSSTPAKEEMSASDARSVGGRDGQAVFAGLHPLDRGQAPQLLDRTVGLPAGAHDDEVLADGPLEVLRPALGGYAPPVDDADPVGETVRLFKVLGGKEDGDAEFVVEAADLLPDLLAADRVETARRLVEKEDVGVVDEGGVVEAAALPPE